MPAFYKGYKMRCGWCKYFEPVEPVTKDQWWNGICTNAAHLNRMTIKDPKITADKRGCFMSEVRGDMPDNMEEAWRWI